MRRHADMRRPAALLLLLAATACRPTTPPVADGFVEVPGGRVFYRIVGDGPGTPLLLIHGGPGLRSCDLGALEALGQDRPVIFYDQLGTGRSDRPDDDALWVLPRFVREVDAIRDALDLRDVHILGHSWGGSVATEYLLTGPRDGVRSLVLAGPLLSTSRWIADANLLRTRLPDTLQRILTLHEAAGTTGHADYLAATDSFYARFLNRVQPPPAYPACEGVEGNPDIYGHMWGPTEFHATGNLLGFDRTDRLHELRLPVLLIGGEFDEARPETLRDYQRAIAGSRVEIVNDGAHNFMADNPEETIRILRAFLGEIDER